MCNVITHRKARNMRNILRFFGILFIIFIFTIWGIDILLIGNLNTYKINMEKNVINFVMFLISICEKFSLYILIVFVCVIFKEDISKLIECLIRKVDQIKQISIGTIKIAMKQAEMSIDKLEKSTSKNKITKLENSKDEIQIFSTENLFLVACNSFEKMFMNKLNGISFTRALYDRYIKGAYTYEQYELLKYIFDVRNKIIHNQKHLTDEEYFQYSDFLTNMYQILKDKWDKEDENRK